MGIWVAIAIYSAMMYWRLPEMVATHWGVDGKPDGWSPRLLAAIMLPGISLLLIGFLWALPKIWKGALPSSKAELCYAKVVLLMSAFFAFLQALILDGAIDPKTQFGTFFTVGLCAFFFGIGYLTKEVPPNQLMGIRTPATLSDPALWKEVHEGGGNIMMGAAILAFVAALIGLPFWAPLGLAVLGSLAPLPYLFYVIRRRRTARAQEM